MISNSTTCDEFWQSVLPVECNGDAAEAHIGDIFPCAFALLSTTFFCHFVKHNRKSQLEFFETEKHQGNLLFVLLLVLL